MRWWWLLAIAALLVLVAAVGGGVFVVMTEAQRRVRSALRAAAKRYGVSPDLLDAIAYVESRWKLDATNMTGGDKARGGAWGPSQITERTAREHGYTGPIAALADDAELAAEWTARIMAARPGGPPRSIEDASAWWNAGKTSASQLSDTHVTRRDYIPKARAALSLVHTNEVA